MKTRKLVKKARQFIEGLAKPEAVESGPTRGRVRSDFLVSVSDIEARVVTKHESTMACLQALKVLAANPQEFEDNIGGKRAKEQDVLWLKSRFSFNPEQTEFIMEVLKKPRK